MQKKVKLSDQQSGVDIFGPRDAYLRQLRDAFEVKIVLRGDTMTLQGRSEDVEACYAVISRMQAMAAERKALSRSVVTSLIESAVVPGEQQWEDLKRRVALTGFGGGRAPEPRTEAQARYIEAIAANDIVFCIGPAGTGKTYLAVAVALDYLKRGELKNIILCRPAVEAGERLGYLPGDLRSKVNPYLRPLYDALHDFMPRSTLENYIDSDLIEILPLAFVRGRTLDQAFIILDEAQNCTIGQMKTFLTRLGKSAKLVVTGDVTQVDLPDEEKSGLIDVQRRLAGIEGVAFARLSEHDIVRHRLVKEIVGAYQRPSAAGKEERHQQ